jgi:hypothetical protein
VIDLKNDIGVCRLCKETKELQLSHIVPKFVGKWLKKTSASGHLRNVVNANLRIQDVPKEYLLCKICEGLFSEFEKKFAEKIFQPFHNNQKQFHYDTWLQKFLISLNWRVAISAINTNLEPSHPFNDILQETLEKWRLFLLGKTKDPTNKNHIVFIGITDLNDFKKLESPQFTHDMNTKLLRSVDIATVIDDEDRLFIYSSVAGIIFVSHIHPTSFKGWTNQTKVTKRGTLKNLQTNDDATFGSFVTSRLWAMKEYIKTLSEKQEQFLYEQMTKDINKTLESKSLGLLNQVVKSQSKYNHTES